MAKIDVIIAMAAVALFAFVVSPLFTAGNLKSYAPEMEKFVASQIPEETIFSKQFFALLQAREFETVKKYLDPKIVDEPLQQKLEAMANLIPNDVPKSIRVLGSEISNDNGVISTSVSSEYEFSDKWLLANIILQKQGDTHLVQGMHVQPTADSLADHFQFEFSGKSPKHYAVVTAAIMLLLFNLYVLALCIRTPVPKRKWLWIIFIVVGVCILTFNWTSGEFRLQLLGLNLLAGQFSQMLYEPFVVTMSVPLGAIVFLLMRRKWRVPLPA